MLLHRQVRLAPATLVALTALVGVPPSGTRPHSGAPATRGPLQEREWFGRVVAQSDLRELSDVRVSVEPVPAGGLMADLGPLQQLPAVAPVTTSDDGSFALTNRYQDDGRESPMETPEASVDTAGRFELRVLEGEHSIAACSPRYGGVVVEVAAAADRDDGMLEIRLPGASSTRGRIVDALGAPIAGARVQVRGIDAAPSVVDDPARLAEYFRVTTDENGCFEAGGLPLGATVWLEAASPGHVARRFQIETAVPGETDGPGIAAGPGDTVEPGAAAASACAEADPIQLEPSGSITGVVVDDDGTPIAGAAVSDHRAQDVGGYLTPGKPWATTDADGRFTIADLRFGDYILMVRVPGYQTASVEDLAIGWLDASIEPDAPTTRDVRLVAPRVRPTVPLEALVLDPRGAPEPEAKVLVDLNSDGIGPWIPRLEPDFTGADGRVVFAEAPPGVYSILASAEGTDNHSGWQNPYRIEADGNIAIIDMRPAPPPVSLSGRFVDAQGNGVARAIIHADGSMRRRDEVRALTQADGTFRFDSLAPGQYVLKAEVAGGAEVIHRELLEVGLEGSPDVTIRMPVLGSIRGTLANARPDELAESWVSASTGESYDRGGQSTSVHAPVGSGGSFRLDGLIPGKWSVGARARNGRRASTEVQVAEGEAISGVDLAFTSGLRLSGTLLWRGDDEENRRGYLRISGYTARARRDLPVGADGTFEVLDLPEDIYDVVVTGGGLRAPFFVQVEVRGDTEIEIPMRGAAVFGTVVDSATGAPIPGVGIRTDPIPQRTADMHDQFRDTDRNGRFEAGPFPAGPWRFQFTAPGYGRRSPILEIGDTDVEELVVALDPTPGLRLVFNPPEGIKPSIISLSWRDLELGEGFQWSFFPKSRDTLEFVLPPPWSFPRHRGPTGSSCASPTVAS